MVLGALCAGGCASAWHSPQTRRMVDGARGNEGELVFSTPAAMDSSSLDDVYFDRRDAALGVEPGVTALQSVAYPGAPAPDLYEQRWISLRRNSDQFIYFDRSPRYDGWYDPGRHGQAAPYAPRRYERGW